MFEWITQPEAWIALSTLVALEIVLGIDNIIFISILVGRLPSHQRVIATRLGIGFALVTRLLLLFSIVWVMGLVEPIWTILGNAISGRDIILIAGGLFLLAKSTHEIHNSLEVEDTATSGSAGSGFVAVILQIAVLDIVFSLDSIITAVGLVEQVSIMVIAVIVAVGVMLVSAAPIGRFVENNPTIKMLALAFLLMIGVTLLAEGLDFHVPKGYIYFAMAFSMLVELLNMAVRRRRHSKAMHLQRKLQSG